MYIAVTYIGGKYIPGEVISEDLSKEKLDWLIRAGAVRKAAPAPAMSAILPSVEKTHAEAVREVAEAAEDTAEEDAGQDDEAAEDATEDAVEDEIDEDAEAPEIDVMAGIVQSDPEEPAKPAAKRKTAANTGNKKTPKGGKTK